MALSPWPFHSVSDLEFKGRGESACMAPQGIIGRQPVSHPLVVVELDMTMDPRWLCGAEYASVKA
jgi:hypothetical protein